MGQASLKNSESPQDFQLLNPHSPNLVVLALIKILQSFHKKQLLGCKLLFHYHISADHDLKMSHFL